MPGTLILRNTKKSEKSKGIIIFAFNSTFKYVRIANLAAGLAKKHLHLPVTIITDINGEPEVDKSIVDNIIITDEPDGNHRRLNGTRIKWKNFTRFDAYNLSPYDQTLLIDCDYFINSNSLLQLFNSDYEFICPNVAYDVSGQDSFASDRKISRSGIPMLWATAIYFVKCERSQAIFDMMRMIKDNYEYYSALYDFNRIPYRNDYALSIAYSTISGYDITYNNFTPWKLFSLSNGCRNIIFNQVDDKLVYYYDTSNKVGIITEVDLHIMNKHTIVPYYDTIMEYVKS